MHIDARARRALVALLVCLLFPGRLAPAAAGRRRRAFHHRPPPGSQKKRAAIKAKLVAAKQKIAQDRTQLSEKKKDIRNTQQDLRVKKEQVARLSDQVRELQSRVDEAATRLQGAEKRLEVAQREVEACTHRLQRAEERLASHRRRLSTRIARSYTAGTVTFLDVLLRATSLADFLDRQYYVASIFNSDLQFLTELRVEQHTVSVERAELEQQRLQQEDAKQEKTLELQQVQGLKQQRQQLLTKVETEKNLKEEELEELEQDSNSIAAMLEGEWRHERELWRELHHGLDIPMPRWTGTYVRPVAGYPISSGFGMRFHPILGYARMHTGIDFAAPLGTPIRAAAAGRVLWASWRGGYGRCIILLHDGGVATLYGHCSAISVYPGQLVKGGDLIGATGSTGLSTGPHLHFEIRVNGLPVNPLGP
jgi:murein DD-endopeptidase MepM/ murein hydrolase activator NlpD